MHIYIQGGIFMSLVIFWLSFVAIPVLLIYAIISFRKKTGMVNRFLLGAAGCFVVFIISAVSSSNTSEQVISEPAVKTEDYDELATKVEIKENELAELESKIKDNQESYDEAMKIVKDKESAEKSLDEIESKIEEANSQVKDAEAKVKTKKENLNGKIKDLENDIKSKEKKLASLTGQIKEKKSAPITLSAGQFTVGKDIPEGRYKAVTTGGQGNFFVNGGADVNAILGNGGFGEKEYIFNANDGDEIEITTSVKFIPVE